MLHACMPYAVSVHRHLAHGQCMITSCLYLPSCSFWLQKAWVHDLSLDQFAELTVYSNGGGANVNFDCHRAGEAPGMAE